jgi:hypothetical protein
MSRSGKNPTTRSDTQTPLHVAVARAGYQVAELAAMAYLFADLFTRPRSFDKGDCLVSGGRRD